MDSRLGTCDTCYRPARYLKRGGGKCCDKRRCPAETRERDLLEPPALDLVQEELTHDGHTYRLAQTFRGSEAVQAFAAGFGELLEEQAAPNYVEVRCLWTSETGERVPLVVTVQRVDGKTPHELREEERRRADAAETALRMFAPHAATPTCVECQAPATMEARLPGSRDFQPVCAQHDPMRAPLGGA